MINHCETQLLRIAYKDEGLENGPPVLLLHGWPDDASTFDDTAPALHQAGWRTFTPWLRGFGSTRFLSDQTMRSGEIAAMAQDVLDFADALAIGRFAVVGHDWGARIAYLLASVFPGRITRCAALSLGWQPGEMATPPLEQAKAFWYQWFMATDRGADIVRNHGKAFARFMWDSWSPPGWFTSATFNTVATSFENADWPAVTLHAYRVRWGEADPDPSYTAVVKQQISARSISVPTLMIQGGDDRCVLPSNSAGKEGYFTAFYERQVLEGVGHFPTREAPKPVAEMLVRFLRG
jgi:pimeloyl-ACP methyl ester carboxylesterase